MFCQYPTFFLNWDSDWDRIKVIIWELTYFNRVFKISEPDLVFHLFKSYNFTISAYVCVCMCMHTLIEHSALEHICKNQTFWVPNSAVPFTSHVTHSFTFEYFIFPPITWGMMVSPRLIVKMKWVYTHICLKYYLVYRKYYISTTCNYVSIYTIVHFMFLIKCFIHYYYKWDFFLLSYYWLLFLFILIMEYNLSKH